MLNNYTARAIENTVHVRLRNWLKEYPNLNISVDDKSKSTRAVVIHTNKQNSVVDKVGDNVVDEIVQLIKNNAKITTSQISNSLNINKRTVQRKIKILKETNMIKRIDSARSDGNHVLNWKNNQFLKNLVEPSI